MFEHRIERIGSLSPDRTRTSLSDDDEQRAVAVNLGRPIAHGSRSTVYAWGNDAVAKVPVAGTPDSWIRCEADFSTAVHQVGAPVPEFLGFEAHNGRVASIYRRAVGALMWDAVVAEPEGEMRFVVEWNHPPARLTL